MDSPSINRSYYKKFRVEEQSKFQASLEKLQEENQTRKKKIKEGAVTIQEKIEEIQDSNVSLNEAIMRMLEYQSNYRGFESSDLEMFHENHFRKLNEHLARNNKLIEDFVMRFRGEEKKVAAKKGKRSAKADKAGASREKYEEMKRQLKEMKLENKKEITELKKKNKAEVRELREEIATLLSGRADMLPEGFSDLLSTLRFDGEQQQKVKKTKKVVGKIVDELKKTSEKHEDVRTIEPEPQDGKDINLYDLENVNENFPKAWKTVHDVIKDDCKGLKSIRKDVKEFVKVHEVFIRADTRSQRKREREDDEIYSVKYCFQGQKRYFGFNQEDYTINEWKTEILQEVTNHPANELVITFKNDTGEKKEIKGSDKLSKYSGKTLYIATR